MPTIPHLKDANLSPQSHLFKFESNRIYDHFQLTPNHPLKKKGPAMEYIEIFQMSTSKMSVKNIKNLSMRIPVVIHGLLQ